ncbi:MAG TPA: aldo/keto reductase [Planctomycetota bacterium]|nr:aldo/keto reductase [Planctomycetota bacterium]
MTAAGTPGARLPRRPYGKSGEQLSIIGFGGLVVSKAEPAHAARVVAEAVERGINYFDVAPTYGDAEVQLGPALEPYRKHCFLACKTTQRERGPAAEEFNRSLERLRTDHFDLYQLHGLMDVAKDVDVAFGKGGVMELVIEEQKAGRIRHIGFSAHTEAAALAAMDRHDFDSVLFPINFCTFLTHGLGARVIAEAQKRGMAILALKALARQKWPKDDPQRKSFTKCWYQPLTDRAEAGLALRFTLGQPITAAVTPGEEVMLRLALDVGGASAPRDVTPLSDAELQRLRALAATLDPIFPT